MAKRSPSPMRAIRAKCLDCCCGSIKYVRWCPCDGVHGSACPLWPLRFGVRPATAAARHGADALDPACTPPSDVPLESCAAKRKASAVPVG